MSDNPLAALAMRERAAEDCDGFCKECASAIRALPTTFTDAELLAAAMQLLEVRAFLRQAMAAWQMAYEEPDRDELSNGEADKVSARWFAKWMADGYPTTARKHDSHGEASLSSADAALAQFMKGEK